MRNPEKAKKIFKSVIKSPNPFTPKIVGYTMSGSEKYAVEISSGIDFSGKQQYGAAFVSVDSYEHIYGLSKALPNLDELKKYIESH